MGILSTISSGAQSLYNTVTGGAQTAINTAQSGIQSAQNTVLQSANQARQVIVEAPTVVSQQVQRIQNPITLYNQQQQRQQSIQNEVSALNRDIIIHEQRGVQLNTTAGGINTFLTSNVFSQEGADYVNKTVLDPFRANVTAFNTQTQALKDRSNLTAQNQTVFAAQQKEYEKNLIFGIIPNPFQSFDKPIAGFLESTPIHQSMKRTIERAKQPNPNALITIDLSPKKETLDKFNTNPVVQVGFGVVTGYAEDVQQRPTKFVSEMGIGFGIGKVVGGLGKGWQALETSGRISERTARITPRVVQGALAAGYVGVTGLNVMAAETPKEKGEVIGRSLAELSALGIGYGVARGGVVTRSSGGVKTPSTKEISLAKSQTVKVEQPKVSFRERTFGTIDQGKVKFNKPSHLRGAALDESINLEAGSDISMKIRGKQNVKITPSKLKSSGAGLTRERIKMDWDVTSKTFKPAINQGKGALDFLRVNKASTPKKTGFGTKVSQSFTQFREQNFGRVEPGRSLLTRIKTDYNYMTGRYEMAPSQGWRPKDLLRVDWVSYGRGASGRTTGRGLSERVMRGIEGAQERTFGRVSEGGLKTTKISSTKLGEPTRLVRSRAEPVKMDWNYATQKFEISPNQGKARLDRFRVDRAAQSKAMRASEMKRWPKQTGETADTRFNIEYDPTDVFKNMEIKPAKPRSIESRLAREDALMGRLSPESWQARLDAAARVQARIPKRPPTKGVTDKTYQQMVESWEWMERNDPYPRTGNDVTDIMIRSSDRMLKEYELGVGFEKGMKQATIKGRLKKVRLDSGEIGYLPRSEIPPNRVRGSMKPLYDAGGSGWEGARATKPLSGGGKSEPPSGQSVVSVGKTELKSTSPSSSEVLYTPRQTYADITGSGVPELENPAPRLPTGRRTRVRYDEDYAAIVGPLSLSGGGIVNLRDQFERSTSREASSIISLPRVAASVERESEVSSIINDSLAASIISQVVGSNVKPMSESGLGSRSDIAVLPITIPAITPKLDVTPIVDLVPDVAITPRIDLVPAMMTTQVPRLDLITLNPPPAMDFYVPPVDITIPPPIEIPPVEILIPPPVIPGFPMAPGGGGGGGNVIPGRSGFIFEETFPLGDFMSDTFGIGGLSFEDALGIGSRKRRKR